MEKSTECMTDLPIASARKPNKCPYCRGTGSEIVYYQPPDYPPGCSAVEIAIDCRRCNGKKDSYIEDNKQRLELPYLYGLSAFNPSIYTDKDGNPISFNNEYTFVRQFVENYKEIEEETDIKGIYIYSRTGGNGKTFLASCICFEMFNRHQLMPVYVTENSLLEELEKTVSESQLKPRDNFKKAPVLFIDDLWRKKTGRDWVDDELFNIIDWRYTHKLPTIITSNVPLNSEDIDKRIASRLNDMCAPIRIPDVEIRDKMKTEKRKKLLESLQRKDSEKKENEDGRT